MYIKQVKIQNIRSIESFEMNFEQPAGWHVIIGDNGAGKSSVVRAIALTLLNLTDINASSQDWSEWLKNGSKQGSVDLSIERTGGTDKKPVQNRLTIEKSDYPDVQSGLNIFLRELIFRGIKVFDSMDAQIHSVTTTTYPTPAPTPTPTPIKDYPPNRTEEYWFSVSYGPFRRFTGGNQDKEKRFRTNPNLGGHLSIFGEDIALTEALLYLINQYIEELDAKFKGHESPKVLDDIIRFVNDSDLLLYDTKIDRVDSKGVYFIDGYGNNVSTLQMSDGYRSVLSMIFELIRQLIRVYGADKVFNRKNESIIDLPGVVLIDEIDAHLHPTWQTKIGQWFTQYFPNIQFIVTTHSPLICRASENGTIWRLAAPKSTIPSGLVDGIHRDRLIYGNVLDAYSTEVFGKAISISTEANDKRTRLGELSIRSLLGSLSKEEENELIELKKIFPTEKTVEG
jgi:hypothetical protein